MAYKNRIDYLKDFGAKKTIVSEIFKEAENNGKSLDEVQSLLLTKKIVRSGMLNVYTQTYNKYKNLIGWM
jgi:hypothetical protein